MDLPGALLEVAGCLLDPLIGHYVVPSEPTMRRMAHDIDADAADIELGAGLRVQARAAAAAATPRATKPHNGVARRAWAGGAVVAEVPRTMTRCGWR